jgi:hypothetical protein
MSELFIRGCGYTDLAVQIKCEVNAAIKEVFKNYPSCSIKELSHIAQKEIVDIEYAAILINELNSLKLKRNKHKD